MKNIYCSNCNKKGHMHKVCNLPIISFGIIAFRRNKPANYSKKIKEILLSQQDNTEINSDLSVIMVQRKDTYGYVDFLMNLYKTEELILSDMSLMTIKERYHLQNYSTKEEKEHVIQVQLDRLGIKSYNNEYNKIFQNFMITDVKKYIDQTTSYWVHPEWGFPKGRRNQYETDIASAKREFIEETGYKESDFKIIESIEPIVEIFIGTNNITYQHNYYIAELNDDAPDATLNYSNYTQIREIGDVAELKIHDAIKMIRSYDTVKKNILLRAVNAYIKILQKDDI